jgi:mRNA (guanine-N7-)-methyltransferase
MYSDAAAGNVARHYSDRRGQTLQERKRSDIFLLRELNNWVRRAAVSAGYTLAPDALPQVKAALIRAYTQRGDFVLVRSRTSRVGSSARAVTHARAAQDLACGKGGDLPKWKEAGVGAYCGIDIALESVRSDGRLRYNVGQHAFPAALFVGDCWEAPLPVALHPFGPFDVASCQFALHYSFGSEARARRALQNVASLLRAGGVFLGTTADADVLVRKLRATHGLRFANELYAVEFDAAHAAKAFDAAAPFGLEYRFTLADAVDDVAEYLVHRPTLERLASECGLELLVWQNFHDFVRHRLEVAPEDRQLWVSRGLGGVLDDATGMASPSRCALSDEEWEVAHLYAVFAFRKARAPGHGRLHRRDPDAQQPVAQRGEEGQAEAQLEARRTPTRLDPGPWRWNLDRCDVKGVDAAGKVVDLPG